MSDNDRMDDPPPETADTTVSRRGFVQGAAATATIATVATFWFEGFGDPSRRRRIEPTKPGAPLRFFTEAQHRAVEAISDRLLPSSGPDSPGARDVNVAGYMDAVLADEPITEQTRTRITHNLGVADQWARERFQTAALCQLPTGRQDEIVKLFERHSHGVLFLRVMLEFTLECFFGDPVHGGNVNGIGWKWIGHRPGSPRPSTPGWTPEESA